mgnify:CR=1 FL=1
MILFCARCKNIPKSESDLDLHHLVPKYMDGTDKDGREYLCQKCHDIMHNIIPSVIWRHIPEERKSFLRMEVKKFCVGFIREGDTKKTKRGV